MLLNIKVLPPIINAFLLFIDKIALNAYFKNIWDDSQIEIWKNIETIFKFRKFIIFLNQLEMTINLTVTNIDNRDEIIVTSSSRPYSSYFEIYESNEDSNKQIVKKTKMGNEEYYDNEIPFNIHSHSFMENSVSKNDVAYKPIQSLLTRDFETVRIDKITMPFMNSHDDSLDIPNSKYWEMKLLNFLEISYREPIDRLIIEFLEVMSQNKFNDYKKIDNNLKNNLNLCSFGNYLLLGYTKLPDDISKNLSEYKKIFEEVRPNHRNNYSNDTRTKIQRSTKEVSWASDLEKVELV